MGIYDQTYRRSLDDPEGFWADAAQGIDWIKPWDRVLDDARTRRSIGGSPARSN